MLRLALTVALLLAAPLAFGHHTPPGADVVNAGTMHCGTGSDGTFGVSGTANSTVLPILRTTDNGNLQLVATGTADPGLRCKFEVVIKSFTLHGVNPMGGLSNVVSSPCAAGASCTATAAADWWLNFVGPNPTSVTHQIDVHFDLRVNGFVVGSGTVSIIEPSLPALLP